MSELQQYLQDTREVVGENTSYPAEGVRDRIICKDGWSVSIQVGSAMYCEPRINGAPHYSRVEAGFPDNPVPSYWLEYAGCEIGKSIVHDLWLTLKEMASSARYEIKRRFQGKSSVIFGSVFKMRLDSLKKGRASTTIYPCIPAKLVERAIDEHGGIANMPISEQ